MADDPLSNPEFRFRQRELDLKEREIATKEREQGRWLRNPVFVGLIATALGLCGNAYVTWYQNIKTEELAHKRFQYELLEEATKTDDTKVAAARLEMLLSFGFIEDPNGRIRYLIQNPNQIPLVPEHNHTDKPPRP